MGSPFNKAPDDPGDSGDERQTEHRIEPEFKEISFQKRSN